MGARGPQPAENPGKTIGVYLDGATLTRLEDVTYTRKRPRNFIAAAAIRRGLPLVSETKKFRDIPTDSRRAAAAVPVYVDGATVTDLEAVRTKHDRKASFIAAEAIRLGLKEVEKLYPAVRKSKKKAAKKSPARAASKEPRASAGRKSSARAGAK